MGLPQCFSDMLRAGYEALLCCHLGLHDARLNAYVAHLRRSQDVLLTLTAWSATPEWSFTTWRAFLGKYTQSTHHSPFHDDTTLYTIHVRSGLILCTLAAPDFQRCIVAECFRASKAGVFLRRWALVPFGVTLFWANARFLGYMPWEGAGWMFGAASVA